MLKLILTFLITLLVVSYFYVRKVNKLENKVSNIEIINDSLSKQISYKDSLIDSLKKDTVTKISKINIKQKLEVKSVTATWYNMHGSKTYSGELFHKDSLIAAHYTKMGTYLKVTNLENGKSVIVKVIDRMGSFNKNKIDLSKKAFNEIANSSSGRIKVYIEKIII